MSVLLRPRAWGAHLLVVAAVAAAVALGLWQLAAWEAGRAAEARDLSDVAPVALTDVMGGDDRFPGQYLGQPVTLSGEWLTESTLYVADRRRDGQDGFWVMTPVLVEGSQGGARSGSAMPIVRGWSSQPDAEPATGPVEITGWLQPSEGSNLPDTDRTDDIIPEMRVASVTEHVDDDLYSGFVVARDADSGTERLAAVSPDQIPSVSAVTSLKNLLYAIQWWLFGLFAIYVWQRWCRDQVELEQESARVVSSADEQPVGSSA